MLIDFSFGYLVDAFMESNWPGFDSKCYDSVGLETLRDQSFVEFGGRRDWVLNASKVDECI